ncbi:MAG: peptide deformylase [Firmicutes bacterium]|nr:peptide deformylase [Bacillota bacterium]
MAEIREIITEEDPLLHQEAMEVRRFNSSLHSLLDDMKVTMYKANGVGLAAPQVGISKRVIVVDDGENGFFEMVNPVITQRDGSAIATEYCLSVPDRGGRVQRSTKIKVKAQDRFGNPFQLSASGMLARIFQHEIDHLEGKLFTDVMLEEVRD